MFRFAVRLTLPVREVVMIDNNIISAENYNYKSYQKIKISYQKNKIKPIPTDILKSLVSEGRHSWQYVRLKGQVSDSLPDTWLVSQGEMPMETKQF